MLLILLVWLTIGVPESPFYTRFTWGTGLAESELLREPQDKQDERQWKAGTYRGITVGKSTATELFKKWGKPRDIGYWEWDNPKNPKYRLYHFDSQEEHPGRIMVEVELKTGKVGLIDVSLDELSLTKAIELFGNDYIETRYEDCTCDPGLEVPFFESPDGHHVYIEYRSRGIAMPVYHGGQGTFILFVDKPIGFKSAKECEKIPDCRPKRKSIRWKRS